MEENKLTRINKFLSEIGYCSRRAADKLIDQGRVKINCEIPLIGTKVSDEDDVSVNGKVVHRAKKKKMVYIAFNQPVGTVCTTDQMREKNNITRLLYTFYAADDLICADPCGSQNIKKHNYKNYLTTTQHSINNIRTRTHHQYEHI